MARKRLNVIPYRGPSKAALQALLGEERQGSERSFRRKAETQLSGLCLDDMPVGTPVKAHVSGWER